MAESTIAPIYLLNAVPPLAKLELLSSYHNSLKNITNFTEKISNIVGAKTPNIQLFKAVAKYQQDNQWKLITGVDPEKSEFILGTPIYNEKKMGASCFAVASVFSNIPLSVHVWQIYITNLCTDNSEQIVLSHLKSIGLVQKISIGDLGNFDFDLQIDSHYTYTSLGNHKYIHINTKTASKANAWRILNEIARNKNIPIVMSYDANVSLAQDGPLILFKNAYQEFILEKNNTVIISAITPEEVNQDQLDDKLKGTGLSPRQVLPFGLLVPKVHRVNGKFVAWDPYFYSKIGIPLCKLDDIVMAKIAQLHGKKFKSLNSILSYEWGVPTLKGRVQMLARFTTGYLQMSKNLNLGSVCPEFRFFTDTKFRKLVLTTHAHSNKQLIQLVDTTIELWDKAIEYGFADFKKNPDNPAFESIEGSK